MGYCIELIESNFVIEKSNTTNIVNALKDFAKNFTDEYNDDRIMWVDKENIIDSDNIEEIFEEIRYPLIKDNNENYTIDYFCGEKLGDDFEIFKVIAPYIVDGSYLEYLGEDGEQWKYIFKNGECKVKSIKKSYDEE
jgi:hypothetical protein